MENQIEKKYITIVYVIEDMDEWRKTNPLTYNHHGMQAITVGCGDAYEKEEAAKSLLMRCHDQAWALPTDLGEDLERFLYGEND